MLVLTFSFSSYPTGSYAQDTSRATYPIDLPTALRLAGAQNLDVQIARARLEEARANHTAAIEKFIPWLTPGGTYRNHDGLAQSIPSGVVSDGDFHSYSAGATLTAELKLGDAIYESLAAKQVVKAAAHAAESQTEDATVAAALGYYDLANARAEAEVLADGARISRDYQKQLHEAVGAGIAFRGDELRVQVQSEHFEISVRQARERQRVTAARLAELLHLDATIELVPANSDLVPLTLVESNTALAAMVEQALHARPELKQSQAMVSAARNAKNGATYGPLVPFINAQGFAGGFGGGPDDGDHTFGGANEFLVSAGWRIGPGGLFDSGRIHAGDARLQTARLSGEKVHDQIAREVVEASTHVDSLRDQLTATRLDLATTEETLRLTQARREFAVGAVLEVIQAQEEWVRARQDYLGTVSEYDKAQYELSRAMGRFAPQ